MFKKWAFLLAVWYVAGTLASSILSNNQKKKEFLEAEWVEKLQFLFDDFKSIHGKMYADFKEDFITDKHVEKYKEYKKEFLSVIESYKETGENIVKNVWEKGGTYLEKSLWALDELYNKKASELAELTGIEKKDLEKMKKKLQNYGKKFQKELEKVVKKEEKIEKNHQQKK